jgi:Pentapeptide repeats (8 copies)
MANEETLAMLKAGHEAWKRWHGREIVRFGTRQPSSVWSRGVPATTTLPIDLAGANLQALDLARFDLRFVDFSNANLSLSRFEQADLRFASFRDATARDARFAGADLSLADCDGADFTNTDLAGATCHRVKFQGASLVGAKLFGAVFTECSMDGANLSDASLGATIWANLDFRRITNLTNVRHVAASTLGLDAVLASAGEIPEVFLKGCGLPDAVIAYISSLAGSENPIRLYSSFIQPLNARSRLLPKTAQRPAGGRCSLLVCARKSQDRRPLSRRNRCNTLARQIAVGAVPQLNPIDLGPVGGGRSVRARGT